MHFLCTLLLWRVFFNKLFIKSQDIAECRLFLHSFMFAVPVATNYYRPGTTSTPTLCHRSWPIKKFQWAWKKTQKESKATFSLTISFKSILLRQEKNVCALKHKVWEGVLIKTCETITTCQRSENISGPECSNNNYTRWLFGGEKKSKTYDMKFCFNVSVLHQT